MKIDGNTYGDPSKELHWVASTLSLRKIRNILEEDYSIIVSHEKISRLLAEMGYSKQVNKKWNKSACPVRTAINGLNLLTIPPTSIWRTGNRSSLLIQRKKRTLAISRTPVRNTGKEKIPTKYWITISRYLN